MTNVQSRFGYLSRSFGVATDGRSFECRRDGLGSRSVSGQYGVLLCRLAAHLVVLWVVVVQIWQRRHCLSLSEAKTYPPHNNLRAFFGGQLQCSSASSILGTLRVQRHCIWIRSWLLCSALKKPWQFIQLFPV